MMCGLSSNPAVNKSLVFKWRMDEGADPIITESSTVRHFPSGISR